MLKQLIVIALMTSIGFASTLSKDVKDAGLIAIPADKGSLLELFLHTLDGRKPEIVYPVLPTRTANISAKNIN
ncbi:hypothetical protein MNB_SM-4-502 [hydrothermal vent metagenome]|uniref:Uncharacterized protein n=1 Tax=hydrothermal vent metagenome TaxID=652676 RepID=A0A1W1BCJ6_9ZZZZ